MPDKWKNYWERNGSAPKEVIVRDLGDDPGRWLDFAAFAPEEACRLIAGSGCLEKASLPDLIALFALLNRSDAGGAGKTIKGRIKTYLEKDALPGECERAVKELLKNSVFSPDELRNTPAYRRIRQKRLFVIAGILLLLAGISAGLFFIKPRLGIAAGAASCAVFLGTVLYLKKRKGGSTYA